MVECDLEFADKKNEHIVFQLDNDLAGRVKLRAGAPPSRDCRIPPTVTARGCHVQAVTSHVLVCISSTAVVLCANRWVASEEIYGL